MKAPLYIQKVEEFIEEVARSAMFLHLFKLEKGLKDQTKTWDLLVEEGGGKRANL